MKITLLINIHISITYYLKVNNICTDNGIGVGPAYVVGAKPKSEIYGE